MRWVGIAERAFDMMCSYAATREIEDGIALVRNNLYRFYF